jgi:predicted acyl esterase
VHGAPVVELDHRSDNPYFDVFVRISEVDGRGRSTNISDGYRRFVRDADDPAPIRLALDEIAHRFTAGNRIRLLIAGGSHPRYARNLGTGEHPRDGVRMVPSTQTIGHGGASRLLLPIHRP